LSTQEYGFDRGGAGVKSDRQINMTSKLYSRYITLFFSTVVCCACGLMVLFPIVLFVRILVNFIFGFYTEQLTNDDQWKVTGCSDRNFSTERVYFMCTVSPEMKCPVAAVKVEAVLLSRGK